MPINSSPDWSIELDAGQPLERLLLASPASTAVRGELLVYREGESGRTLRIVEVISSDSSAQPSREIVRFLDLTQDSVLPLYTISSQPRIEWNMEAIYRRGGSPVVYLLRGRTDVFRLQRLLTGYKPVGYFENVDCSVIFKSKRIPILGRDSQHKGRGEIQLWWPEMEPSSPIYPVSPTSSRSSQQGITIQSTNPEPVGPMNVVSVQTNINRGEDILVSVHPPPPLLVAFLQDDCGYTMLKTHITNLGYRTFQDGRIDLQGPKARTFNVNRLSVKRCQLNSWNLCAINTKASGIDSLKCTYLTLKFEDLMKLKEFEENLLRLQARWLKLELDRLTALSIWRSGRLPMSTAIDGVAGLASRAQPSRTASLPSLPEIEPLGTEFSLELEIGRPTRELDGSPVVGPFELDNRNNGDERRDRTYWEHRRSS